MLYYTQSTISYGNYYSSNWEIYPTLGDLQAGLYPRSDHDTA